MQDYEKLGTFASSFVGLGWEPPIRDAQGRLVPAWL
jgi:hypothetical protein